MKSNRIVDWIRPIGQILILIVLIVLAVKIDFAKILLSGIKKVGFEDSELPAGLRIAVSYGRWGLSIFIWLLVFFFMRNSNAKIVLNAKMRYHNHFYVSYLICRYILSYKKCSLTLVPVPMQFKLVYRNVFEEYIYGEGIHKAPDKDKVKIKKSNEDPCTSTVNLVISDTYKTSISQLPDTVLNLTTYEIDCSSEDHTRYDSEELVKKVISTVRNLPNNVVKINVFAATNATNTYNIAKEAFSTGGRDTVQHLVVFPQSQVGARNFANQGMKIY